MLSYERNRLSAESTRALICVGLWSIDGYVEDTDLELVASSRSIPDEEDERDAWDDSEWEENKDTYMYPDDMDMSEM